MMLFASVLTKQMKIHAHLFCSVGQLEFLHFCVRSVLTSTFILQDVLFLLFGFFPSHLIVIFIMHFIQGS